MPKGIFALLLKRLIILMDVTSTAILAVNETLNILNNECIDSVLMRIELEIHVVPQRKMLKGIIR